MNKSLEAVCEEDVWRKREDEGVQSSSEDEHES